MAKQLLIETRMNSLSLCEGVEGKTTHPGCLGTISGPCADFKNPTRNNNFYSRKLWENVFKDPLVVESLEDRVLIGELDHPGDRLETKATNAAIVMTGYEFNDANGTVDGTFDILDTPNGKILRSLLDYGCKIGVSSRGEGDVTNSNGVDSVDEESYYFVGFDAVVLPAVKKAKPTLQESVKRENLKESLEKQINEATTKYELDLIKKVVEATQLPNSDSLLESVNIKSKELEGINDSSNLIEDLERSTLQIQTLINENKELKQEVTNSKSRIKKFIESQIKMKKENGNQKLKLDTLNNTMKNTEFSLEEQTQKVESLEHILQEARYTIKKLNKQINVSNAKIKESKAKISNLEESLERSQKVNHQKSTQIKDLQAQLNEAVEQGNAKLQKTKEAYSVKLKESKAREEKAIKSMKSAQTQLKKNTETTSQVLESYVTKRSKDLGISSKRVMESIKPNMTTQDIDKLLDEEVDRTDRYSKLPTTDDRFLGVLSEGKLSISTMKKPNEEDVQTKTFMENYYKVNK